MIKLLNNGRLHSSEKEKGGLHVDWASFPIYEINEEKLVEAFCTVDYINIYTSQWKSKK